MLLDREGLLIALRSLDEELGAVGVRGKCSWSVEWRWHSPTTLDGRRATGDGRRATGDGRRATGDGRRSTVDADVDAIFVPAEELRKAAVRVAERLQIEDDWLNDGAKAFTPGSDPERIGVFEGDHLSVAAASPRHLLAMKLSASRLERDQDDIRFLYGLCGFSTAEDGLDLVESTYPTHAIAPRVRLLLEEMFPGNQRPRES
jgi:hypothetical protein